MSNICRNFDWILDVSVIGNVSVQHIGHCICISTA